MSLVHTIKHFSHIDLKSEVSRYIHSVMRSTHHAATEVDEVTQQHATRKLNPEIRFSRAIAY